MLTPPGSAALHGLVREPGEQPGSEPRDPATAIKRLIHRAIREIRYLSLSLTIAIYIYLSLSIIATYPPTYPPTYHYLSPYPSPHFCLPIPLYTHIPFFEITIDYQVSF